MNKFNELNCLYDARVIINRCWQPVRSRSLFLLKPHLSGTFESHNFYVRPINNWKTPKKVALTSSKAEND